MKTTICAEEIRAFNPCKRGLDDFVNFHGEGSVRLSQCLDSNSPEDVLWLLGNLPLTSRHEEDLREFARNQALINIEKIKPYCSAEDYESVLHYLTTGQGRSAARSAAWSAAADLAWSASDLAWSASEAAWSAAWSAAGSAAEVAWLAAESAWLAARSAARSASEAAWSAAWSAARSASESAAESAAKEGLRKVLIAWESEV